MTRVLPTGAPEPGTLSLAPTACEAAYGCAPEEIATLRTQGAAVPDDLVVRCYRAEHGKQDHTGTVVVCGPTVGLIAVQRHWHTA